MSGPLPRLVLAAHGSSDRRYGEVVRELVDLTRHRMPAVPVQLGYLEHGPPDLPDAARDGGVVVPLLLSAGHHVDVDIPRQAPSGVVTAPLGPDVALVPVLARRLREAGWGGGPVVLAAAGSRQARALDQVREMAGLLGDRLGVEVTAAFLSAGEPRVDRVAAPAVSISSYLLAPGQFQDALTGCAADIVAEPIGVAAELVDVIVQRYDAARG